MYLYSAPPQRESLAGESHSCGRASGASGNDGCCCAGSAEAFVRGAELERASTAFGLGFVPMLLVEDDGDEDDAGNGKPSSKTLMNDFFRISSATLPCTNSARTDPFGRLGSDFFSFLVLERLRAFGGDLARAGAVST